MPCWMKTESGIDITRPNQELLEAALKDLGYRINEKSYSQRRGYEFSADHVDGDERKCSVAIKKDGALVLIRSRYTKLSEHDLMVELKKAYSVRVVKKAAETMRWQLKQNSPSTFIAMRRTS